MNNDAQIKTQIILDSNSAEKGIKKLEKRSDSLAKSFSSAGKKLTLGLTLPIVGIGTMAVKSAMEWESTGAKFNTVFEDMADDVDDFIMEFKQLAPVTKAQGRILMSGIQDMLVPMGFARDEATETTKKFTHLAGALANFGDESVTVETTMGAFQSALAGQLMPLRSLGIVTSQAEIQQTALAMSGKKLVSELTEQDKIMALLEISYNNSTDALNAFTEENLDTDTQMKQAMATFQDSLAVLGNQLLPIFTKAVGLFSQFATWLGTLDENTLKWIVRIGGLLAILGPVLWLASKLGLAFKIIGGVFAAVTSPIGLIVIAITAVIVAIALLIRNFNKVKAVVSNVFRAIGNIARSILQGIINNIFRFINALFTPINAAIKAVNRLPGINMRTIQISTPRIPALAQGTNYFPKDGLAYLHKGEQVVPKRYNPHANPNTAGITNTFNIENMSIREDRDISRVAEELFYLQQREAI